MSLDKPLLVDFESLNPPPHPWARMSSLGTLYLLGDVSMLGLPAVERFLASHPLILAKSGRNKYVVIGQFRAWEILQVYAQKYPTRFKSVNSIIKLTREEELPATIAENLLMEGLLLSLSPDFATAQISQLWLEIPESIRNQVLPSINTQVEFSTLLNCRSRSNFDQNKQKRLNAKLIQEIEQQPSQPGQDDDKKFS